MKKNAMLKVAAVVLVAVLLTTCAISSTFAKYVTAYEEKSSATASVAKWGVKVNTEALTNLGDLFVKEYNSDGNADGGALEVISTDDAVVAPGTYRMITIASSATGTPEVSGKITTKVDLQLKNWTVANDLEYCPLVFYVNGDPISKADGTTIAEFEEDVEDIIAQLTSKEFDANQNLAEDSEITIAWEWLFEIDGEDDVVAKRNENDTYLANKTGEFVPTVTLIIGVDVEQTGAAVAKP